jgi:hypothetical protein
MIPAIMNSGTTVGKNELRSNADIVIRNNEGLRMSVIGLEMFLPFMKRNRTIFCNKVLVYRREFINIFGKVLKSRIS